MLGISFVDKGRMKLICWSSSHARLKNENNQRILVDHSLSLDIF